MIKTQLKMHPHLTRAFAHLIKFTNHTVYLLRTASYVGIKNGVVSCDKAQKKSYSLSHSLPSTKHNGKTRKLLSLSSHSSSLISLTPPKKKLTLSIKNGHCSITTRLQSLLFTPFNSTLKRPQIYKKLHPSSSSSCSTYSHSQIPSASQKIPNCPS